jgi:hypothetical protein
MKGYPTVSDKYNVAGATLTGATPVQFGELVKKSATKGYFESAASGVADVYELGGFVLATNVKLAENWPGTTVQVNPGEAFNLFVSGFMAIELDSAATVSEITANSEVCVILANGKVTTSDKYADGYKIHEFNNIFDNIDSDFIETLTDKKLDWESFISAILEHFYTNISDKLANYDEEGQENKLLIKSPGCIYSFNNSLTVEKDSDYKFEVYTYDSNTNPHPIDTANQIPMSFKSIKLNDKEKLYVFGYRYTFISVSERILIPTEYVSITNNKFNWISPNIFANIIN